MNELVSEQVNGSNKLITVQLQYIFSPSITNKKISPSFQTMCSWGVRPSASRSGLTGGGFDPTILTAIRSKCSCIWSSWLDCWFNFLVIALSLAWKNKWYYNISCRNFQIFNWPGLCSPLSYKADIKLLYMFISVHFQNIYYFTIL